MQPHSMCATALANFVWNRLKDQQVIIKGNISMKVDYISLPEEKYKTLYYTLYNFTENSARDEFKVNVVRTSGGINCQMTVRRKSLSEGATIEMTHGQQHVAGLMEEFSLYRTSISSGRHHNSKRYGDFSGTVNYKDRLTLTCGVKKSDGSMKHIRYDLEIQNINYEVIDLSKPKNVIDFPQSQKQEEKLGWLSGFGKKAS